MTQLNFIMTEEQSQFGHAHDTTAETFFATLARLLREKGVEVDFESNNELPAWEFVLFDEETDIQLRVTSSEV